MFIKFVLGILACNFLLLSSTGVAQEKAPPIKDPRALCREIRQLAETWKAATIATQKEHYDLINYLVGGVLTVKQKHSSSFYTSISQTFTRKLINDHYGLCVELGFDYEIPNIVPMAL